MRKLRQYRGNGLGRRSLRAIIFSFSVLSLAGLAVAQNPPLNPPGLPSTYPPGKLGPTSSSPTLSPGFPNPNNSTWTALGPAPLNAPGGTVDDARQVGSSGRIAGAAVDPTNSNNIYIAAA